LDNSPFKRSEGLKRVTEETAEETFLYLCERCYHKGDPIGKLLIDVRRHIELDGDLIGAAKVLTGFEVQERFTAGAARFGFSEWDLSRLSVSCFIDVLDITLGALSDFMINGTKSMDEIMAALMKFDIDLTMYKQI
jgi:hypothetical protein